ncbi:MAG: hypothetical protein A2V86_01405 [Deltaproteobacteria bacterium RBG_16_49_23]|nr:MAG: hypothetical protein A2V86_01405 [Deltaproteobacteria bacterium RBG_16_49_23]
MLTKPTKKIAWLTGATPFILIFVIPLLFCIPIQEALAQGPTVVSTSPANGATNVPGNQTVISITFSEPMSGGYSITDMTGSWSPMSVFWSAGNTIINLTRPGLGDLAPGTQVTLILNYQGSTSFQDLQGIPLPTYTLSFTILLDSQAPYVVSTSPPNGAINVSRDLPSVSIVFNKPMRGGTTSATNWGSSDIVWSTDRMTVTFVRTDPQRLGAGVTVSITLSPPGYPPYESMDGHALPTFTLSFTTEMGAQLQRIEANPAKGFHWPYYLSVPNSLSQGSVLLVEPNNSGTWSDDPNFHDGKAHDLVLQRSSFAIDLDAPLLVPTFPRPITPQAPEPGGIYTHALDRYSLYLSYLPDNLKRIDLQLIAMINDAREKLAAMGYQTEEKVFLTGFSASGAFVSRFTALHPGIVRAVAQGSPGGWPIAPVGVWNGIPLRYPVGVADVEQLVGVPFDLNTFLTVPKYIYVGNLDTNDALDTRDMPQEDRDLICAMLNCSPLPNISQRWPIAEQMYDSVAANAQFVIYPGVGHNYSPQIWSDLLNFFRLHKPTFLDVLSQHWANDYVMAIYNDGITAGCAAGMYCPGNNVTREQMAAFIVRAKDKANATTCLGTVFDDVTADNPHCANIERLRTLNVTLGCGPNLYCPLGNVTRQEMASFLVRAVDGADATVCAGDVFNDVPLGAPHCANIERLRTLNVTLGCSAGMYCPANNVLRDQMAAFLARAFLGMQ